jgi:hypothetical protein
MNPESAMNTTTARLLPFAVLCGVAVLASPARAQEFVVEPVVDEPALAAETAVFSQAELDQLLAPVALYPDALLSQVLIAATYPLEIVEAARWSRANTSLEGEAAVAAVAERDWDPSVKYLVAFPDLLARMDEDLDWTQRLGEAMLLQESEVMDSIQFLRAKAEDAGALEDSEHVRVVRDERTIIIEPARERVVYVPYYDTRVVYGPWWHPAYPPIYWTRPAYYSYASTGIYWSSGIHISAGFFFTDFYWPHRSVVVVRQPRYYYPPPHHYRARHYHYYTPGHRWKHNPHHRRHVKYDHHELRQRYPKHVRPPSAGHTGPRDERRANQPRNYRELQRSAGITGGTQRLRGAEPDDRLRNDIRPGSGSARQTVPAPRRDRQSRVEARLRADRAARPESRQRVEPRPRTGPPARIETPQRADRSARSVTQQRTERSARIETPRRVDRPARITPQQRSGRPARIETPQHADRPARILQPSRSRQAAPAPARSQPAAPARSNRESRPESRSRSSAGGSRAPGGNRRPATRRVN